MSEIKMPVVKLFPNGDKIYELIDLENVDFIENDGKKVLFHMGEETYYMMTKTDLATYLTETVGFDFDMIDKPYLVNLKKIRCYDPEYGKVYFTNTPMRNSKYCTIARVKQHLIEHLIQHSVSENEGNQLEITLPKEKTLNKVFKNLLG